MENLTLVIPAKNEEESLPLVIEELKKYNLKIIIVLEENDIRTINSLRNLSCKFFYKKNMGFGVALIQGINLLKLNFLYFQ